MALSTDFIPVPVDLKGVPLNNPTSIQFGPDGRLYVSQQDGTIRSFNVKPQFKNGQIEKFVINNAGGSDATSLVKNIPNHNDDGTLASLGSRQVTGLVVTEGANGEVVIYVGSSDPRVGGGSSGNEQNLDTNSSMISRLVRNASGTWSKVDLVIGLPRSEENHSINGMDIRQEMVNGELHQIMYVITGGNTNRGAPSNNFAWTPEYYYSAGILRVDLTHLESIEANLIANGGLKGGTSYVNPYVYALPTLDDPTRPNNANGQDTVVGVTNPVDAEAANTFGGNDGRNQAKYDPNGPVQIYSMGYRNAFDLVITEAGHIYTFDNGPNNGWGDVPLTAGGVAVTNSNQVATNNPNIDVDTGNDNLPDQLHLVTSGFYAGHPNPVYASGAAAGLYSVDASSGVPIVTRLTYTNDPNNNPNTTLDDLPVDWDTITGGITHPEAGVYQVPGFNPNGTLKGPDGSLITINSSTNGITEYIYKDPITGLSPVTNNPNAEVLVSASFNGDISFIELVSNGTLAGTSVTDKKALKVNGVPLDLTSVDSFAIGTEEFASSIWVAQFSADSIVALVPSDFQPPPDIDQDDDGLNDNIDPLQFDANNGLSTVINGGETLFWDFNPSDSGVYPGPPGDYNIGMTGWMINGVDLLDGLTDLSNTIRGGAPGIVQVKSATAGDSAGTTNNQRDALQTGFSVGQNVQDLTIKVPVFNPFSSDANGTVIFNAAASLGIALGTGSASDFIRLAIAASNPSGSPVAPQLQLLHEEGDVQQSLVAVNAPELLNAVDDDQIELLLNVDVETFQVTAGFRYQVNGSWQGQETTIGTVQLAANSPIRRALAGQYLIDGKLSSPVITLTATSRNAEPFTADFLDLTIESTAKPGVLLQETNGSTTVTEAGAGDTYSLALSSQPTGNVTINLTPNAQIALSTAQVTFTPQNWNLPQVVTVTAVNDALNEGEQTVSIAHNISSTDPNYAGLTLPNLSVTVIDNDIPPFMTINDVSVNEGDGTATFTVSLSAASESEITVDYTTDDDSATSGSDYIATSGTLTFAPGTRTQTITVDIVDDTDVEGDHYFEVNLFNVNNAIFEFSEEASGIGTIRDNDTNVLYRINVGGNTVAAADGGLSWSADTVTNPSPYIVTSENKFYSTPQSVNLSHPSLPGEGEVAALFQTHRHDAQFAPQMTWALPVEAGTAVEVRFYFAEWWTNNTGVRVFDLAVEGSVPPVFDNIDPVALAGQWKKGFMLSHLVTVADGTLNLDFINNLGNPAIAALEILKAADLPPSLAVNDVTVNEGDGTATFTVSLSQASSSPVSVNYATSNGSAIAGSDYTATNGTLTFAAGTTSQTITVPIINDTVSEGQETFNLNLSNPVGATLADGVGVATIVDNDIPPSLAVNDVTVNEGDGTATFTVSLSQASSSPVSVNYATSNGSAIAGSDYTATNGTLTFAAGTTSQTITVPIINDTVSEGQETFNLNLSNAVGAGIADGVGVATIVDNDANNTNVLYRINVGGNTVAAADGGLSWSADTVTNPSPYIVTSENKFYSTPQSVNLSHPSLPGEGEVAALFQTHRHDAQFAPQMTWALPVEAGTAVEVRFYFAEWWTNNTGVRVFDLAVEGSVPPVFDNIDPVALAGQWKKGFMLSHLVTVADGTLNLDFINNLGNPAIAALEILKAADLPPSLAVNDVTVNEGDGTVTFTVSLSQASSSPVSVNYATSNGSAIAGSDYTATNGTLTFAAGTTSQTITVPIINDTVSEGQETFNLNLSNAIGANIGDGVATGTILDNDPPPTISINDVTVNENDGTATFGVALSALSSFPVSVDFATSNGTAVSGSDYTATNGTLTFAAGTTTKTVTVAIVNDTVSEGQETFNLNLSNPTGATLADGVGVATIIDDDLSSALSINDVTVNENAGTATFTVSLSSASSSPVSVNYATADGTASTTSNFFPSALDYVKTTGTLTFAPNEVSKTISISINDDIAIEGNETFTVNLSNASGASIADATGLGTIVENDGTQLSNGLITYTFNGATQRAASLNFSGIDPLTGSPVGILVTASEEGVAKDVMRSNLGLGVAGEANPSDPFNIEIDGKGPGGDNTGTGGLEELLLTFDRPVKLETMTFKSSNNDDDYAIRIDGMNWIARNGLTSPKFLPLDVSSFNGIGTEFTFTVQSNIGSDDYVLNKIQVSSIV